MPPKLSHAETTALMLAAAHAKSRRGMCTCGTCGRCRHRKAVQRSRVRCTSYAPEILWPQLTREFPVYAEELASTMKFVVKSAARGGAQ